MNTIVLMTTEWSKRLLSYIAPENNDDYALFDKQSNVSNFDKPKVIVTACPHTDIDKAVIHHFQSPAVFVVEGLNNWRYVQGNYVDKVCVWGKNMKEDFIRGGWDEDKLIITGCPRFENHKRRVLIALPSYTKAELDNKRVVNDIVKALGKENVAVSVKRHPGISDEKQDILLSIRACDVVITGASTVALHALLMDKKVIYYDTLARLFQRETHFMPLIKSGIHICNTVEDIVKQVKHSTVVTDYLDNSYGASRKIIDIIRGYYGTSD